jgi:CDP-4-dehydro-6-deoxyglucose reductase, E1
MSPEERALRAEIAERVEAVMRDREANRSFEPGVTPISYAGRIYGAPELQAAVSSAIDFWLTLGPLGARFEAELARAVECQHALLVNSGSSANLLAFASLCSPNHDRPLVPGDEVIGVACAFPTTVNPILQMGCVPVFVDVDPGTLNIDVSRLEAALSPRTRAVMLAHTMGNPFDLDAVTAFCEEHGLVLVEDNCDALGSVYRGRPTGSFGDLATHSFYPPHHITLGEGGAVATDNGQLRRLVASLRDWGRDCWCGSGRDNTCGSRFSGQYGTLPLGYDHKYVFKEIGYNLKPTEIQAAIGLAQIERLPAFREARRANYDWLSAVAREIPWLRVQQATDGSEPNWFGLVLTLSEDAPVDRARVVSFLEQRKIQTRQLFCGNLLRQPAYRGIPHRQVDDLRHTDAAMERTFFIGVYPGIDAPRREYMAEILRALPSLEPLQARSAKAPKPSETGSAESPGHAPDGSPRPAWLEAAEGALAPEIWRIRERLADVAELLAGRRVAVTGGTGLLGSYLCRALLALHPDGHPSPCRVVSVARHAPGEESLLYPVLGHPRLDHVCADAREVPAEAMDFDYLVFGATLGSPAGYLAEPTSTLSVNAEGLRAWLDHAASRGVRGVLYLSSGEIYGSPEPEHVPTPESYAGRMDPCQPRSVYAEAKRFGEALALAYVREKSLPVSIVRPFQVFGPGIRAGDGRALADFVVAAARGETIVLRSAGAARRTFCAVEDATCAFLRVLLQAQPGSVYNVGAEGPKLSILELAERIGARRRALDGAEINVEVGDPAADPGSPDLTCPSVRAIERDLGWVPERSLDDLLDTAIAWRLALEQRP